MTVVTRTSAKAYFETGDKPTQAQFSDLIDSSLFYEDTSDLGRSLVSASAAVSARGLLGSGTVGDKVFTATTTASAQNNIGGGAVGKILFEATTTASAQDQLGAGTVGKQLLSVVTTASASDILGGAVPTTAAQSDQETGTAGAKFVSPSVQQFHPSAAKAWSYTTYSGGTPSSSAGYNIASVGDTGSGVATLNYTVSFSSANYAAIASLAQGSNGVARTQVPATGSVQVAVVDFASATQDYNSSTVCFGDQ